MSRKVKIDNLADAVLEALEDFNDITERELEEIVERILAEEKNGIATDLVFYTEEEFGRSDCRLVQEIRKDGRILWESPADPSLGG